MKSTLAELLAEKSGEVHRVTPDTTVLAAVRLMNQARIGAVMVTEDERICGIFTERDVLCRVVAEERDPKETLVREVMTDKLVCVGEGTTVEEAMNVITHKHCRHLPITDERRLIGLISIGDLTRWVTRGQQHRISQLFEYISGPYPQDR